MSMIVMGQNGVHRGGAYPAKCRRQTPTGETGGDIDSGHSFAIHTVSQLQISDIPMPAGIWRLLDAEMPGYHWRRRLERRYRSHAKLSFSAGAIANAHLHCRAWESFVLRDQL
jgi:hypothetical protein